MKNQAGVRYVKFHDDRDNLQRRATMAIVASEFTDRRIGTQTPPHEPQKHGRAERAEWQLTPVLPALHVWAPLPPTPSDGLTHA